MTIFGFVMLMIRADPDVLTMVIEALDRQDADYGLISVKRFDKVNIQCYPASIQKGNCTK